MTPKSAVYFPGLNGIRALAAILVIVCHIDEWSYRFGLASTDYYKRLMGAYAVVMFFVLSGFLITYLLIKEKEKFERIAQFQNGIPVCHFLEVRKSNFPDLNNLYRAKKCFVEATIKFIQ